MEFSYITWLGYRYGSGFGYLSMSDPEHYYSENPIRMPDSPLNPNSYQSKYNFENYYGSAAMHGDYGENEKRRIYNVL